MLAQGRQKIEEVEGKHVVFLKGATWSEKSTSIALMGTPLEEVLFEDGRFVVQISRDSYSGEIPLFKSIKDI